MAVTMATKAKSKQHIERNRVNSIRVTKRTWQGRELIVSFRFQVVGMQV